MTPEEMRKEVKAIDNWWFARWFPFLFTGITIRILMTAEICERLDRLLAERERGEGESGE
jgi:hypothetical protein